MTAKLTLITAPLAVSWVTANITEFSKPQGEAGGDCASVGTGRRDSVEWPRWQ